MSVDVIYGLDGPVKDRLVANAEEQLKIFASAAKPGSFLVDSLPFREFNSNPQPNCRPDYGRRSAISSILISRSIFPSCC